MVTISQYLLSKTYVKIQMTKFYENLLACISAGLAFVAIGYLQNLRDPKKPSFPVYDFKLKQFIQRKRGVNETVLNSLDLEYRTRKMLDYYKQVENQEQSLEFIPLKNKYECGLSGALTVLTMIKNLECIETIDKEGNVGDEYKPLKELLIKCNEIHENTEQDSLERVIKIYKTISEYVKPGELNLESVSIVDLVNGRLGDCNDLSPAYFALFNYYHINCHIILGKTTDSGRILHAWLYVKTSKSCFELDPTWYEYFTPLDTRNEDIMDIYTLKNEDMKYKK